jgi:hypothetical protein
MPSAPPDPDKPTTRRRILALSVVDKTVAAVITFLVGAGLTALGFHLFGNSESEPGPPPALSSQWLRERAEIARKGWRIAQTRKVDLRGVGEPSTILVLEPPAKSCIESSATRSQQIRIYDTREGWLKQALTFEPKLEGCPPMNFKFVHVGQLREYDNTPLILGKFSGGIETFPGEISVPVVISWNARFQRYTLDPLLVQPTRLAEFTYGSGQPLKGYDRTWYREAKRMFEHPVELGHGVRGYGVGGFAFGRSYGLIGGPLAAGAFRLTAGNATSDRGRFISSPIIYQQAIWSLGTTPSGKLSAGECSLSGRNMIHQGLASEEGLAKKLIKGADDLISSCVEY